MSEELKLTFDKYFENIDKHFDNMRFNDIGGQLTTINKRLDKLMIEKEETQKEIRNKMKKILDNLDGAKGKVRR
ncbi:hypothetical protein BLX88_10930 [Bacillus obstructivus]|nr:hypothetical protein BLX88_10930 [Bacillus obstructivus]